ncbi:uncharacterized protein LOC109815302 [Cajanus cajan]|uniref:uncharacterized protein LOC109815302 n=1 Tax=Cajanus cajan TaxID=3821 RepID=UPI00098DBE6F|nr:uncharacterized protein LOC109815302 [Cajanus cajan]
MAEEQYIGNGKNSTTIMAEEKQKTKVNLEVGKNKKNQKTKVDLEVGKNEEKQKTEKNREDQVDSRQAEKEKIERDQEVEKTKECKEQELEPKLDCIFDDSPLGFERATNEEHKLESQDPLEEINLGTVENRKVTYISKYLLQGKLKEEIIQVLHEYKDCFAWDYDEMPGLDRELVEHRLPMIPGKKPVKQSPRRFAPEVVEKIKGEIERLLKAKFIRTSRYPEWISNIVPVMKKNGKLRVCIDFRDLNMATPKDEYPMPITETMIDAAAGALGVYEWVMMPFGLKNAAGEFLGFVIHQKGIEVNRNKTKAIMETKPPSNKKEL